MEIYLDCSDMTVREFEGGSESFNLNTTEILYDLLVCPIKEALMVRSVAEEILTNYCNNFLIGNRA